MVCFFWVLKFIYKCYIFLCFKKLNEIFFLKIFGVNVRFIFYKKFSFIFSSVCWVFSFGYVRFIMFWQDIYNKQGRFVFVFKLNGEFVVGFGNFFVVFVLEDFWGGFFSGFIGEFSFVMDIGF